MLIPFPGQYQKRRKPPRRKGTPVAQTIGVVQVATNDPPEIGKVIWVFSEAVTMTAIPTGLCVYIDNEWMQPISVEDIGSTQTGFTVYYNVTQSLDGNEWAIDATPTGIVQAAEILVPQSGVVEAP